jgi:hypothetical protein
LTQFQPTPARFSLGQVVITPGALESLDPLDVQKALKRHQSGDWGEVGPGDAQENDLSLQEGFRILSAYRSGDVRFWIITEADRSSTCVLLPEEY